MLILFLALKVVYHNFNASKQTAAIEINGREHFWGLRYENIVPLDIGSGQGLEITGILRGIVNLLK